MNKVRSITEAFSMQPETLSVTSKDAKFYDPENSIERIELEVLYEDCNVYAGYNFKGVKKFQYLEKSVNVHYF